MKYKVINDQLIIEIDETTQGQTILEYFHSLHLSKKTIHLLRQNKEYLYNHQFVDYNQVLKKGDLLQIKAFEKGIDFECLDHPLDIVYEDEFLLVINKEPGMIIHPEGKQGHHTLVNVVANYYKKTNQNYPVRFIHRLDRDTSGLIMFCKCTLLQPLLDYQIANKTIKKGYYALIEGHLQRKEITVNQGIARDRHHNQKMIVSKQGKTACTHFKEIKSNKQISLVSAFLETGRKHQIRVHLASLNHPILSDPLYGKPYPKMPRLALHAYYLRFFHPLTNQVITLQTKTPPDFCLQSEPISQY